MIDEDRSLSPRDRRRFRGGLRRSPTSGDWELSFAVSALPEQGPRLTLPLQQEAPFRFPRKVYLHSHHGWRVQPGASYLYPPVTYDARDLDEQIRKRWEISFSPETTWALVLLHDLLALGPGGEIIKQRLHIYRPLELWALTGWQVKSMDPILIPWPAPLFLSVWEFDIFLHHWNAVLALVQRGPPGHDDTGAVSYLVYAWVDAAAAVLLRADPTLGEKLDWNSLVNRLTDIVANTAERSDPQGLEWLTRLAYFFWPAVSGIDEKTAKDILSTNAR